MTEQERQAAEERSARRGALIAAAKKQFAEMPEETKQALREDTLRADAEAAAIARNGRRAFA